ncbi:Uu.00g126300.m01.CDS01 [Anthostomella pinea]|uniref:Uu.00g126300.m01.CDS01 n=1 Tax=Anthostomella pinea TaxID=933095 RepID=A0AAI8YHT0_9PEZI|nr:Uu.00g126300.m01.CDS01 [Anthostomella pinea]
MSPSLVVFGPQVATASKESLTLLRQSLLANAQLNSFAAAIRDLPQTWSDLTSHDPLLTQVEGTQRLQCFTKWLNGDSSELSDSSALPNAILTPLTVIIHLVNYFDYMKHGGYSHRQILDRVVQGGGIQGMCTGLLMAVSLALSAHEAQVVEMATIALKLSVGIGAYVDLDGHQHIPPRDASCLAVRWKHPVNESAVTRVLEQFPEVCLNPLWGVAYISVVSDDATVTVTVDKVSEVELSRRLAETGATARRIQLQGRFHTDCHQGAYDKLVSVCNSKASFRFPTSNRLLSGVKSGSGHVIGPDQLVHEVILRSMLLERSEWKTVIKASLQLAVESASPRKAQVVSVGPMDSISRSLISEYGIDITHSSSRLDVAGHISEYVFPHDSIAIVGMACRLPGADALEEFWQLLLDGTSILGELPPERFSTLGLRRTPKDNRPFIGNFLRDGYAFDHKFFNKSSREASSMDPQHKVVLQVAYEALEAAGYFGKTKRPTDVGCYVGVAASDYEDNVASHAPTAFSVLGTVRAFISGKISHFFGLSGPSMVFDTACSSSSVAIHTACQAIKSGDCSMAIAGGVNVITSPTLHQNLAAANFLSPTGASKSFDARADGYCRGEGAALVVLKKYSSALADGDHIVGVIAGSAVNQNANTAPITVPVSQSQTALYREVLRRGQMESQTVSFVEAHGTGTPKGDPIECASIRDVFGCQPSRKLYFGSVKGSIGHLEGASGAAAVIKLLLMMQYQKIPPQASFTSLNPNIPPLEPSNMEISRTIKPWDSNFMAGCVNNYGAAGSNAAILICQPPTLTTSRMAAQASARYLIPESCPAEIRANSPTSLVANCKALLAFLGRLPEMSPSPTLADVAYWLAHRHNPDLPHVWRGRLDSLDGLRQQLRTYVSSPHPETSLVSKTQPRPVVLVFSGQTGNTVQFSEEAFRSSVLLQSHLSQCDQTLKSLGYDGIFPEVLSPQPIQNVVKLHCTMFALQYSCARSWIDSGLEVKAMVGHSFGQLTALCAAGAMSLEDGLKLIAGRASLIQDRWGPDRGAMISIKADRMRTEELVHVAQQREIRVQIACYNGPTSHVVVGPQSAVTALEQLLTQQNGTKDSIQRKRLEVTHGFHSQLVDNIMPEYEVLVNDICFKIPNTHVETCSTGSSWSHVTAGLVAQQFRQPVFFDEAINRIQSKYGPCVWLEAGTGTAAIPLVRHALEKADNLSSHSFHQLSLHNPHVSRPSQSLADTTLSLWDSGVNVHFWPFHTLQKGSYAVLHLPPYQFEKHHHWLEYVDRHDSTATNTKSSTVSVKPLNMVSLVNSAGVSQGTAVFHVAQETQEFQSLIRGHSVLGHPLCPLSLYIEIATRAVALITPKLSRNTHSAQVNELEIYTPLGMDTARNVQVTLERTPGQQQEWLFTVFSSPGNAPSKKTRHASAILALTLDTDRKAWASFERTQRLIGAEKCESILADPTSAAIQGSLVYKMFDKVVNYSGIYRGVQKVVSRDREVAGYVAMSVHDVAPPGADESITNPLAIDNFTQVAGLHMNGLDECGNDEVFICSQVNEICLAPNLKQDGIGNGPWLVYSNYTAGGERQLVNDIYVFDVASRKLVMIILGVSFTKTNVNSLQKVLARANKSATSSAPATRPEQVSTGLDHCQLKDEKKEYLTVPKTIKPPRFEIRDTSKDIKSAIFQLLHEVADVPLNELQDDTLLSQAGIDSLMATEVINAIGERFNVQVSPDELLEASTASLCALIQPHDSGSSSSDEESSFERGSGSKTSPSATSAYDTSASGMEDVAARLQKIVGDHLDIPDTSSSNLLLSEAGVDSLLGIELGSAIEDEFGVNVDMTNLPPGFTFAALVKLVMPSSAEDHIATPAHSTPARVQRPAPNPATQEASSTAPSTPKAELEFNLLEHAVEDFRSIKGDYLRLSQDAGYAGFRTHVYPKQRQLVSAYVLQAFSAMSCNVGELEPGEPLPPIAHIPKHDKVMEQYSMILQDEGLLRLNAGKLVRTETPIPNVNIQKLLDEMTVAYPQHTGELKLLNSTGSKLADVLLGKVDPISILFGTKASRDLLEDIYVNSPMWLTGTKVLSNYFTKALGRLRGSGGKIKILELGAGTGGTTRHILQVLASLGIEFTYTFTDLSSSLVVAAKRKFAQYGRSVEYSVLDVETTPPAHLRGQYHVVLSSNCIHATKDLVTSSRNIRNLLRDDGIVCLLELTRNIYWLDCVFGLLEGWWLFNDGRRHALADEFLWQKTLMAAGFKHVDWSDDDSEESDQYRLIVGFASAPGHLLTQTTLQKSPRVTKETIEYHNVDGLSLQAEVYYPRSDDTASGKRPVALMVHGGGHIMLSRKDIRPRQTRLLIDRGFLPISIDYRLCPEVTLPEGPMADVCTALRWARHKLPTLTLARPDVRADGRRVVVVGWSTGGTLAMTTAFTAPARGLQPPDGVLAFYCPTDYEDRFFRSPNFPQGTTAADAASEYDLLEGVRDAPITAYNVPAGEGRRGATGAWMSLTDPRSRIALHMNWRGQALPTLLDGLPSKAKAVDAITTSATAGGSRAGTKVDWMERPQPSADRIAAASPYARIVAGEYTTPTFLVHGTKDDLVPWEHTRKVGDALEARGVPSGTIIVDDAVHLFDLYPDPEGKHWGAVTDAYEMMFRQLRM